MFECEKRKWRKEEKRLEAATAAAADSIIHQQYKCIIVIYATSYRLDTSFGNTNATNIYQTRPDQNNIYSMVVDFSFSFFFFLCYSWCWCCCYFSFSCWFCCCLPYLHRCFLCLHFVQKLMIGTHRLHVCAFISKNIMNIKIKMKKKILKKK